MANEMIQEGLVQVNGETELRKRNKIYPGFRISFEGQDAEITSEV